jgi:hypothetical protein
MGQGKLLPSLIRCLLLVVTSIQGLTPDLHDLASSRAMILLHPFATDDNSFPVEDDSPDDVCEAMDPIPYRGVLHHSDHLSPIGFTLPVGSPQSAQFVAGGSIGGRGVVTRSLSLHCELCRLLC